MKYQPKHVQQIFSKSSETIRQWSMEVSAYLSLDANPTSGHRRYTDDDLRVLAYVNIRKSEGASNDTIDAELRNGQRAEPPREASAIVAADERSELLMLQIQLETLQDTNAQLLEQIARTTTAKDRAEGAMAAIGDLHRAEVERLEKRLTETQREIRALLEENARLKA